MFQVGVMCGYHSIRAPVIEFGKYRLGQGTAEDRFGSRSKLINHHKRPVIGMPEHLLHVYKVGAVGAEVVLKTLFVADINKEFAEDTCLGTLSHRNGHAALQHVLYKSHSLEAH